MILKIIRAMPLLLLLAGTSLMLLNACRGKTAKEVAIGSLAPTFEISDIRTGKRLASSAFSGKVLFINFWATWCPPCREELPSIEAVYREMSLDDKFAMITILYRDNPSSAIEYMKENGYTFPVYSDPGDGSSRNFGVTGVPETYIVDKKGVLRRKVIGAADWGSAEEKGFIKSLLTE